MNVLIALSLQIVICVASKGYHSIELPIKSKHDLDVIHSPSHVEDSSTHVDVPGGVLPVHMVMKTQSSPLYVKQEHRGTKGSYQKSDSKDEPHKLVHEVVKPVIQELKEVITPYRKIVQVIEPVREERLTKVHKNEGHGGYGGNDGGYGGNGNEKYGNDDKYGKQEEYKEEKKNEDNNKKYDRMGDINYEHAESQSSSYFIMGTPAHNSQHKQMISQINHQSQSVYNNHDNYMDSHYQEPKQVLQGIPNYRPVPANNAHDHGSPHYIIKQEPMMNNAKYETHQESSRYEQPRVNHVQYEIRQDNGHYEQPRAVKYEQDDLRNLYENVRQAYNHGNQNEQDYNFPKGYWNFLNKIGQTINY